MVKIYSLGDPESGEIRYVGQTCRTLQERLYEHTCFCKQRKRTHKSCWVKSLANKGLKPCIFLIEECEDSLADEREKFHIHRLRSVGADLTNANDGGGKFVMSEQTKIKISLAQKGKPCPARGKLKTESDKERIRDAQPHARKVEQYSKEGSLLKIWQNISMAANELGLQRELISLTCRGKRKSHGGYGWKYQQAKV